MLTSMPNANASASLSPKLLSINTKDTLWRKAHVTLYYILLLGPKNCEGS